MRAMNTDGGRKTRGGRTHFAPFSPLLSSSTLPAPSSPRAASREGRRHPLGTHGPPPAPPLENHQAIWSYPPPPPAAFPERNDSPLPKMWRHFRKQKWKRENSEKGNRAPLLPRLKSRETLAVMNHNQIGFEIFSSGLENAMVQC